MIYSLLNDRLSPCPHYPKSGVEEIHLNVTIGELQNARKFPDKGCAYSGIGAGSAVTGSFGGPAR